MVSWALLGCKRCPRRQQDAKKVPKVKQQKKCWGAFGPHFRHFFSGSGSAFKTRHVFWSNLGSAGLRRVPVHTGAQFSLLQPDPKKAPKWEPKWSVLGSQIPTILTVGQKMWSKSGRKRVSGWRAGSRGRGAGERISYELISIDRSSSQISSRPFGDGRIENACGGSPAVPQMLLIVLCHKHTPGRNARHF